MIPFLQQVAHVYATNETNSMANYVFVFPNKRSATFFDYFLRRELKRLGESVILPTITNISDFVSNFSTLTEAGRYDMLFTLYDQYRRLPDVDVDFDRFLFWGEMLISDFNDVDRYLVDPDALFANIKNLREISSDYLTEAQRKAIARFWGEERSGEPVKRFWNHLSDDTDSTSRSKFVRLWEVLGPLYHSYTDTLRSRGLATSGMLYRHAADCLDRNSDYHPQADRYIFVGFNVLSTSELKIFTRLQSMGLADFYWDFNSPAFELPHSRAGKFMRGNIREFHSRYQLPEEPIKRMPKIEVEGVPSNIGQTKLASARIDQWLGDHIISNIDNAIDTAVVLPDESLFIPLIHSLPSDLTNINVTMGVPLKLSPVASLIGSVVSLQLRSRTLRGEPTYYYEDVNSLLYAPIVHAISPDEADALERLMRAKRYYNIPVAVIKDTAPTLYPLFELVSNHDDIDCVCAYIDNVCRFLLAKIPSNQAMQRRFIESYSDAVKELHDTASRFGVNMRGASLFKLVERAINSATVRFKGEPLSGLQIMGVLETRALDFKNIIILSMNERVFPRRHYTRSFIPDALRHGFGMSTIDFQESIYAYYFYRLISRAENVTLVYDARNVGGIHSSEPSRYISQLLYLMSDGNVSHRLNVYDSQTFDPDAIEVVKNEAIKKKLDAFKHPGGRRLSASALNKYIACPLNFYLSNVEGYNTDDEVTEYMDYSTFGQVVHSVAQYIYEGFQNADKDPVEVTKEMLQPFANRKSLPLDKYITRAINFHYHKLPEDRLLEPLRGESLVMGDVAKQYIVTMIKHDMTLDSLVFEAAEKEYNTQVVIDGVPVNLRMFIDRVDRVDGQLRFIDYKTGSDELSVTSIDKLFDPNNDKNTKAIMQLLMYCHFRNVIEDSEEPIVPVIYKFIDMGINGVTPLKIGKDEIGDYHSQLPKFVNRLYDTIREIFNPDVPFRQSKNMHSCKFCSFKAICDREETNNKY